MNKELAIECIKTQRQFVDDLTREAFDVAIDLLKQPERTGRWIKHIDDLFPAESTIECSECHHEQPLTIDDNYCPHCGADMRGEQECVN